MKTTYAEEGVILARKKKKMRKTESCSPEEAAWKFIIAYNAFREAKEYSCQLIDHNPADSPLHAPLLIALIAQYAIPFKQCPAKMKLPDSIVPDEYRELHRHLIVARDKGFVHMDMTPMKKERSADLSGRKVRALMRIGKDERIHFGVGRALHPDFDVTKTRELCEILMNWAFEHAAAATATINGVILPPGDYEVNPVDGITKISMRAIK